MFVTSNVYLNIMFLHIACGFELLHNPFKLLDRENDFPQVSQVNGFTPECVLSCTMSALD